MTLLELVGSGKNEPCDNVESNIGSGIASYLQGKYGSYFEENGLSSEALGNVDKYYQKWDGCADNVELRRYACSEENGLLLLIALALNDIY